MLPILQPANLDRLRRLLGPDTLIALDFDGTLAPIVADRDRAQMRTSTRMLLRNAAAKYRSVVITGRQRAEALQLLEGIPLAAVVGNHGIETGSESLRTIQDLVGCWAISLERQTRDLLGVEIENKGYSLAIHYRRSDDPDIQSKLHDIASSLTEARLIGGKKVLNVLAANAPGKKDALYRLIDTERAANCIFVGDDDTDEEIFTAPAKVPTLTVRVGYSKSSRAEYFLSDQQEIEDLLWAIIAHKPT